MKWRRWSEIELSPLGESGAGGDERGSLPRATRGCVVLNSPSQTGKVSGLKYLCRTDRVDYSLGFIKGSASKARLCGLPFAKQGNGVDLALEEKVSGSKFLLPDE